MAFHIGDFKQESKDYRGWFVGSFASDGPRFSKDLEVKYWEFEPGNNDHPSKTSSTTECTILLTGHLEAIIEGTVHEFKAGQYAIIQPNTSNNLVAKVLEPSSGITIKAPSDVNAKTVLEEE